MPSFAATGSFSLALLVCLAGAPMLRGAEGSAVAAAPNPPSYILVGFVGGFVSHTAVHHGPVQTAQRLQQDSPKTAYIEVFENRRRKAALKTILHLLDTNRDGVLTNQEKAAAHIMLFGHSWGASAVVVLARELDRIGIPVMLTVQVDSIPKLWQKDGIIPDNVEAAVNFYQPHGILHGRSAIKAADDSKTRILGNYLFDYRKNPVRCEGFSWFAHYVTPSHMQGECDPHIWSQVENLILERMQPGPEHDLANLAR